MKIPARLSFETLGGALLCLWIALGLSGCSNTMTYKTTAITPLVQEANEIPENLLLDVGIQLFDPGLEAANESRDSVIFPEIRKAESRFIPHMLMETLQTSASWGAIRIIPNTLSAPDVVVTGKILQSDGEALKVSVTVDDASGKTWYTRVYDGLASRYAYDPRKNIHSDPFQDVYNRMANDLLTYQRSLSNTDILALRTIAELKFANAFSPQAFDGLIRQDAKGYYQINRLPAEGDPMLDRIRAIRERDYLFVDTLQDYYGAFVKDMSIPYKQWRSQSYDEVIALREIKKDARNRTIAGVAAILGGIAAAGGNNRATRTAGQVSVGAGGYLIKSGFDKRAEAKMHIEALQELGDSLQSEIEPQVIELEDRTITLSGTVENQYDQWRDVLKDLYNLETGETQNR
jgi:hypothetical protein